MPALRALVTISTAVIAAASTASAQSIEITAVPTYGTLGHVTGSVSGVVFANYRVAGFIYIDGKGWYTKPTLAAPLVAIAPDGRFDIDVGTGGAQSLDSRAILFCAALVTPPQPPAQFPTVDGKVSMPADLLPLAIDCEQRFGATLDFSGYRWGLKEAPDAVGPGDNRFSFAPSHVFVDAEGKLHLRVAPIGGVWFGSEAILEATLGTAPAPLGYGAYLFETDSDLANLAPHFVFGAFTWDPFGDQVGPALFPNREIDFEASRWGDANKPTNAQSVIQDYRISGNLEEFTVSTQPLRWLFLWLPDRVIFQVFTPAGQLYQWSYAGASLPVPGRTSVHINAWLNSAPPAGTSPAEAVVSRFAYVPEPGVSLQCAFLAGAAVLLARSRRALCTA
jgi:hypothetical protein